MLDPGDEFALEGYEKCMRTIRENNGSQGKEQNSSQQLSKRMKQYVDHQPAYLPSYTQLCRKSIKVL